MTKRRSSQRLAAVTSAQDAAIYDAHVVPRYSALFGRLLLPKVPRHERLQVLDVGCGTGFPALDVLRVLGEGGRVIAIDPDPTLLDVARRRALDEAGKRIFFKVESAEQLSFGDQVFDLALADLALSAFEHPDRALAEVHRVLVPDGRLLLTHAMSGTFEEVLDMFRELALKHDRAELTQRIDRIQTRYPTPSALEAMVRAAGFRTVAVESEEFQIPFGSAAEVFTDAAMRFVGVPEWRWIAGFDEGSEVMIERVVRSLDTYFGGGPLSLRVCAGVVDARA